MNLKDRILYNKNRNKEIYTSYFGAMKKIPDRFEFITICGKAPMWYKGIQYKKLAPKIDFFMEWKKTQDNDYYIEHFYNEVLDELNPHEIVNELFHLSNDRPIILLCYEKTGDFCHRYLVADWLVNAGYDIKEMKV